MRPSWIALALLSLFSWAMLQSPRVAAHPRPFGHTHTRPQNVVIVVEKATPARAGAARAGAQHGVLDLNVKPKSTEVWVDERYRGTCNEFDGRPGKLHLPAGIHDIKLVLPDGTEVERQVRVRGGIEFNVGLELR